MRTPSMTPDQAITEIGIVRGELLAVDGSNRAALKKFMSSMGIPSSFVATKMRGEDLLAAYNDLSDETIGDFIARASSEILSPPKTTTPADFLPAAPTVVVAATTRGVNTIPSAPALPPKVTVNTKGVLTWDQLLIHLRDARIIPNPINRIFCYGPPRTGKSSLAADIFGCERICMSKTQLIDDFIGGRDLVNGTTVWVDGPVVRAMRAGRLVCIDELGPDTISPETRYPLHCMLDEKAAITLPTGERVEAQPGYGVIATSNKTPGELPQAILDRFDLILYCDTLSAGFRARLGRLANAAQNSIAKTVVSRWVRPASPNLFLAAVKLESAGVGHEDIARLLYPEQRQQQSDLLTLLATAKLPLAK